jgi:hypothetical protein
MLMCTATARSEIACKPLLSVVNTREIRNAAQPALPWTWRATIATDLRFCATQSGPFEIDFVRIKEYAPDIQFTQRFRWAARQFDVSMELAADESIHQFRIGFIAPCVCREYPDE